MSYSDFNSYFWSESSGCLKNKQNIRNAVELDIIVNDVVAIRLEQLLQDSFPVQFDTAYLQTIHRVLFGDIYDWAGEFRTCPMSRNQDYCPPERIRSDMDTFCRNFRRSFLDEDFEEASDVADSIAHSWAALNKIHPFRDGNGRSQYVFFNRACHEKGYEMAASRQDLKKLRDARDMGSLGKEHMLAGLLRRSIAAIPDRDISGPDRQPDGDYII